MRLLSSNASSIFLLFFMMFFAAVAGAQTDTEKWQQEKIQKITNQLQQHTLLAGEFRQTRRLQGFSRAIESTGIFIYWQGHGLYWETRQPFFQASTFIQDGVIDWRQSDGFKSEVIDNNPILKNISSIIVPLVGGDLEKLERTFDASWDFGEKEWSITLEPVSFMISRAVSGIEVTGQQFIRNFVITTSGNDITAIDFFNITLADHPDYTQCRYFQRKGQAICDVTSNAVGLTQSN